ncbi:MAG: transporter, family, inner rane transport protein [Sphingomonadales bacterium]|nr:transporter, family, inner rane transport protein [Sphingomonadales bacterium]
MSGVAQARQAKAGTVIFALAVGGFAIGTNEFATMGVLPYIAGDFHVDVPTAGHLITAYALGVVVGAPLLTVIAAKASRRTMLITFMLMFALGNVLSALAHGYREMLILRFASGLPHGAYFGIASIVAASVVPANRRAAAVGRVLAGLSVANIVGVPLNDFLGETVGWRWGFAIVAALALVTAALVVRFAPVDRPHPQAGPMRELTALARPQVWLTLAIGAVGFGGVFAVYTYLSSTLEHVTRAPADVTPLVLMVFGAGMTLGFLILPRFADRALMPSIGLALLWLAAMLALYPLAAHRLATIALDMFGIGLGTALAAMLQTRLMDVSGHAQALGAALNQSAFNTANAVGPWLGGMAIAAGFAWTSTGWVGAGLALAGWLLWLASWAMSARSPARPHRANLQPLQKRAMRTRKRASSR